MIIDRVPEALRSFVLRHFNVVEKFDGALASVSLRGKDLTLAINKPIWDNLSDKDREKLLLHEIAHVVRGDLNLPKRPNYDIVGIACDAVINELLDIDDIGGIRGWRFRNIKDALGIDDVFGGWSVIYEKLLENANVIPLYSFDEILETDNSEEAKEKVIEMTIESTELGDDKINKVREEVFSKMAGFGEVMNRTITVDVTPRQLGSLDKIIKLLVRISNKKKIRKKTRSYRREGVVEGVRGLSRIPIGRILCVVDVSGSFEDKMKIAFAFARGLSKFKVELGVFADYYARVNGGRIPDVGYGTNFSSVTEANNDDYIAYVVFTDGYFEGRPNFPNVPIIWVMFKDDAKSFRYKRAQDFVVIMEER